MNIAALIVAVIAAVVFLCAHFKVPRSWASISLGLFLLTLALILQFVWQDHQWIIHASGG